MKVIRCYKKPVNKIVKRAGEQLAGDGNTSGFEAANAECALQSAFPSRVAHRNHRILSLACRFIMPPSPPPAERKELSPPNLISENSSADFD